jgi:quercetin dioxygenase-like cupin family protein
VSELLHFPGSGQTIEIVLDAAATDGELSLLRLRLPAGAGAPLHRHTQESETLAVREGELEVELEGDRRTLRPGEAVFLPRGSLHAFRSPGGGVVDVLAVPAGLEEFFRVACVADPADPPPDPTDVAAALERHGLDFSGA